MSFHQIDIIAQGISAIPETQKMHSVNVISPFIIEIKEHFYADVNFNVLQGSNDNSNNHMHLMGEQNFTNKNLKDIKPGQWILVQYEGEYFLAFVLAVSKEGAKIQCVEHPYGVSGLQDLQKETRAV